MPPGVTRTTAKALGKVTGRVPDHSKPIPNYNEADSSADLVAESSKSTSWRHQRSDLAHFSKEELSRARCGDKNISRKQKAESKRQPDQNDSLDPLDM